MAIIFIGACHYFLQKMSNIIIFLDKKFINQHWINLENLKEFFSEEEDDPILLNYKLEGYINKIKENAFFAGTIEFYIAVKLLNINIAIYERNTEMDDFTQYSFFQPESATDEYIILNLENRGHFNLINIDKEKKIFLMKQTQMK